MTDTLRDRIAAVLYHRWWYRSMSLQEPPRWEKLSDFAREAWLSDADTIIRELGLTQQWLVDGIISDDGPRPWEVPCETRWTTEWERFNG